MHITIVALGSRGDMQPCVALGSGLRQAGYRVRIATHGIFADFVGRFGFEFAPIEGNPRDMLEGPFGQKWLESGRNPMGFIRNLRGLFTSESLNKMLDDIARACHGTDAILHTILGTAAHNVAEMLKVPSLSVLLQPLSRTRETPHFMAPALPLGGGYNRWTYWIAEQLLWQIMRAPVNRWRRESLQLNPLPPMGAIDSLYRKRTPFVYGFSRFVVPRPPDWPDWHQITGYWFLDGSDGWSPPAGLVDFLSSGPKPVYIGFGSMSGGTAQRLADLAVEAVTLAKQRAVLLGGWAQAHERNLPDHIYAMESAPHDWLFPRMAAVVHHGGAGTTAAGLRAGLPSVITPFFGDQPYWGRRVYALGVGPRPILHTRLTARLLAGAITQAVTSPSMQCRAAALGEQIRTENGVARAVEIVSRHVGP